MGIDGTITPTRDYKGHHPPGTLLTMPWYGLVEVIEDLGYSITFRKVPWYERLWMRVKGWTKW